MGRGVQRKYAPVGLYDSIPEAKRAIVKESNSNSNIKKQRENKDGTILYFTCSENNKCGCPFTAKITFAGAKVYAECTFDHNNHLPLPSDRTGTYKLSPAIRNAVDKHKEALIPYKRFKRRWDYLMKHEKDVFASATESEKRKVNRYINRARVKSGSKVSTLVYQTVRTFMNSCVDGV